MKIILIISGVIAIIMIAFAIKYYWKKKKSHHIRLTMKAIIRWEQLNKKPFYGLDYGNEDDIISLFYSCTLPDKIQKSLPDFKKQLTEKSAKKMIREFEKQTSLISQFQAESKKKNENSEPSDPTYIKDIVSTLVINGLDVHFALNEMELCDLPIFINAYDQKVKDSLESARLWAFIQVSPHLSKAFKSPKDLYHFPWEVTPEPISETDMKEGKNEYQTFLQTGLKM